MKKPELISPAGDLQKLKIAFQYGADAVYASTPNFSMRTREIGFNQESLKEGISYAHTNGKKVYLTVNTFPHPNEIEALKKHIKKTIELKPDAIIVADPGVLEFIKQNSDIPVHLSTQANTTNQLAASFWHRQGAERIVLARELSLEDISLISQANPDLELESFVHGAMCMAYSGRCQISNYILNRDPNRGACAQPCRYKYKMYGLEEDSRPGEIFPLYEDENGTHILNSKDLCMIEYIPELINAGVSSFKIEGRLKSIYYVGAVTRAYRQAIDQYFKKADQYNKNRAIYKEELTKTANRGLTTGFYFAKPDNDTNNYASSKAISNWGFVGLVLDYDEKKKMAKVEVKNYLPLGSKLEIVTPDKIIKYSLKQMQKAGEPVEVAHADNIIEIPLDKPVAPNSFLRLQLN